MFQQPLKTCKSCEDILADNETAVTGYCCLQDSDGEIYKVWYTMDATICGGLMRLANINMQEKEAECPSGLYPQYYEELTYKLCGRKVSRPDSDGCALTTFFTLGVL